VSDWLKVEWVPNKAHPGGHGYILGQLHMTAPPSNTEGTISFGMDEEALVALKVLCEKVLRDHYRGPSP
jgi:hypothetical protein